MTPEEILEEENRQREKPIKFSTLARALNAIASTRKSEKEEAEARARARAGVEKKEKRLEPAIETRMPVSAPVSGAEFQSSISGISEETRKRFESIRSNWEKDLGRRLHNDYFMNILLALAKLLEHGKTLAMKG